MAGYQSLMLGQNKLGQSAAKAGFANRVGAAKGVAGAAAGGGVGATGLGGSLDYDYGGAGIGASAGLAANRRNGMGYGGGGAGSGFGGGYGGGGGFGGAGSGYGMAAANRGSGYGGGGGYQPINYLGSGYGQVCEDNGLNPALVLATVAGAAVAFAVIYRQVTVGRSLKSGPPSSNEIFEYFANLVWMGELV